MLFLLAEFSGDGADSDGVPGFDVIRDADCGPLADGGPTARCRTPKRRKSPGMQIRTQRC